MTRYIDAEKSKKKLQYIFKTYGVSDVIRNKINNALSDSTADVVEVVHAYWKETTHITVSKRAREIHSKLYNCSNCDAPNGRKKSSYCHWCGAKMDGKGGEG